jgi:hypothetical protein
MACEGIPVNSFRASVLHGAERPSPVVASKHARRVDAQGGIGDVGVQRSEGRTSNHRAADRMPLGRTSVQVRTGPLSREVSLVNLSGGGARIEADLEARLWDKVTLVLGQHGEVECAVRWIRGNRFGLEFAHETRIDCDEVTRDATLREVIRNNFTAHCATDGEDAPAAAPAETRSAARHPLIWSGLIRHADETFAARIRNISSSGAMVQSIATLQPDSEVVLDLGNAGAIAAKICWSQSDQAGLAFAGEFDVRNLAACKPEVAERKWAKPEYLRDESVQTSPWASQWGRLSIRDLSRNLSG